MKKDQTVINVDSLDNHRIKPTVPFVGSYLRRGYTQAQIARISNNSPQCINNFIKRHYDELAPLVDDTDNIMTVKAKHIASKAQDKINDILAVDKFDKKDLVPLNIVSGTHVDKYRLLSDKSTSNVSIDAVHRDRREVQERLAELKERRARRNGTGNQEAIETASGEEVKECSPDDKNKG